MLASMNQFRKLYGRNKVFKFFSKTFSNTAAVVDVTPTDALLDNPPKIRVKGLDKNQKITLWNVFTDDSSITFSSHAHYIADDEGVVDVENHMSHGGKYVGIFPEGLVAAMHAAPPVYKEKPKLKRARLFKKNVTEPMKYTLKVIDGHVSEETLYSSENPANLGETTFRRYLMGKGVKRTEIEHNTLRGVLFTPPGDGPFPVILDLFGAESGVKEFRSAMLASYGYAALVLPYYNYKDLPTLSDRIDLDYFLDAVDYLDGLPQTTNGGIGLIGSSKGGEICLAISGLTDKIKACVTINAYHKSIVMNYYYKNKLYREALSPDHITAKMYMNKNGEFVAYGFDDFYHWDYPQILPVCQISNDCQVLIAACDDDSGHGHRSAVVLKERARRFKKKNVSTMIYPEAGHLLDPPFHSHISAVWNSVIQIRKPDGSKYKGLAHYYGGNPYGATQASKDLWKRSLALFHKKLVQEKGLPLDICRLRPPYTY